MKKYENILIRTSLDDEGELPRTGTLSDSPDVIPHGTEKEPDPVSFFIDNYDENVNKELKAAEKNYIYIRGKSIVRGKHKADMYVYYALDTDLDTPAKWETNILKTTSGKSFSAVVVQSLGNIVVAPEAFEWIVPTPLNAQTYSLIGIVVESGTIPVFDFTDFNQFVADNNNVGWTKVTIKTPIPPPEPVLRWKTKFMYKQGDLEREMSFEVGCLNIPVGSYVSFEAENKVGPNPLILLQKTKVSDPKGKFGLDSVVPAGYESSITFSLYCDKPPAASALTFKAYYVEGKNQVIVSSITTTN